MAATMDVPLLLDEWRKSNRTDPKGQGMALLRIFEMWNVSLIQENYWSRRRQSARRLFFVSEVTLGLGTASAVTALPLWAIAPGRILWQAIGIVLAGITVIKAVRNFPRELDEIGKQVSFWQSLARDLTEIGTEYRYRDTFPAELWEVYGLVHRRYREATPESEFASAPRGYRVSRAIVAADERFSWIDERIRELRKVVGTG